MLIRSSNIHNPKQGSGWWKYGENFVPAVVAAAGSPVIRKQFLYIGHVSSDQIMVQEYKEFTTGTSDYVAICHTCGTQNKGILVIRSEKTSHTFQDRNLALRAVLAMEKTRGVQYDYIVFKNEGKLVCGNTDTHKNCKDYLEKQLIALGPPVALLRSNHTTHSVKDGVAYHRDSIPLMLPYLTTTTTSQDLMAEDEVNALQELRYHCLNRNITVFGYSSSSQTTTTKSPNVPQDRKHLILPDMKSISQMKYIDERTVRRSDMEGWQKSVSLECIRLGSTHYIKFLLNL